MKEPGALGLGQEAQQEAGEGGGGGGDQETGQGDKEARKNGDQEEGG